MQPLSYFVVSRMIEFPGKSMQLKDFKTDMTGKGAYGIRAFLRLR